MDNPPVVNEVKAGQSIPIKFSLNGNQGLNIIAAGYRVSQQVDCSSGAPIGSPQPTSSNSGLQYDAASDQYTYVWKTEKSWAGTCRQFKLRLTDNSDHVANFRFK